MISLIQICDYGDFVDGQCLTTTTPSPETTTTTMVENIGELIIIFDADNEMAHCAILSLILIMRVLEIMIKHSLQCTVLNTFIIMQTLMMIMMENQTTATHSRQCYLTIHN